MTLPRQPLQFAAEGFAVPAGLLKHAEIRAAALLRRLRSRRGQIRLQMRHERLSDGRARFSAFGTVGQTSADHVAHAVGAEPAAAVDALFEKLERVLSAATGVRRKERRRTQSAGR